MAASQIVLRNIFELSSLQHFDFGDGDRTYSDARRVLLEFYPLL